MNNLVNKRFGRLKVISKTKYRNSGNIIWLCECDCGQFTMVAGGNLMSEGIKSCGCLQKEMSLKKHFIKHGDAKHINRNPIYNVWNEMKYRCNNPNHYAYKWYGARGIGVCNEWLDYSTFKIWALNNGYKSGLSIDRIDNDGDYEPSNCQFITRSENTRKRNGIILWLRKSAKENPPRMYG